MKTYFPHPITALALPALLALGPGLQPSTILATPIVTQIAAGEYHNLFVMSDGSLWGIGDNSYGEIGLGTAISGATTPTEIVASGVTTVSAGYFDTLFRESDGSLWGTGYNNDGELGDGTYTTQFSPEKLASSGVTVLAVGSQFSLYATFHFPAGPGSLLGTGINFNGQLGKTFAITNKPQVIVSLPAGEGPAAAAVSAGGGQTLFIQSGGVLWGMGDNILGDLGDSTTIDRFAPEEIVASNVVAIAAGNGFSLFVKSGGSLWGMGLNSSGQLGIGYTDYTNDVPMESVASNVTAVAVGQSHTLFIKSDGSLWGMGLNTAGQLGLGETDTTNTVPKEIVPGNVTAICANATHSMFIKSDGSLWAMGDNAGELGDPRYVNGTFLPVEIVPLAPLANDGFETGDFTAWADTGNTAYTDVNAKPLYVHSGIFGAQWGPIGSLGFLSQMPVTAPGTNYALSFWLNSPDGETPNQFQVSWNGATIFNQTNLPAVGWTNIVLEVTATGSDTLQFGARNDNSYFGLDDITLVTLQRPLITGIHLAAGTNLVINAANGQTGGTYFTLMTTNLERPLNQWTRIGTNVLGVSGNFTITVTNAVNRNSPRQQFYDLAQQD